MKLIENLARSLQHHPKFVAIFAATKMVVESLLARHLVRSLLEEK